MVNADGGIHIQVQPPITVGGGAGGPGVLANAGPRRPDPPQVSGIDALVDKTSQRARRTHRPERLLAVCPQLAGPIHTVRAVGHRNEQISEHITGRRR